MPQRAIILTRISDARNGDERGVTDQLADCRALAGRLGWQVGPAATHVITENDTSAFARKKITLPDGSTGLRTVRPGFRQAIAMLGDGRADGLIVYDLDRLARQPRDLEDLLDMIEMKRPRIPVETVTGALRLDGSDGGAMARIMVAIAAKASSDTARRVARARLRQAENGQYGGGGKRPYGFERDGCTVIESEAAEIRRAADGVLSGVSLRQLAASLRERGVPSVTGATWSPETLKDVLIRPRNAALMVHRPADDKTRRPYTEADVVGTAPWEPIISKESWQALCAILTDPARRTGPGGTPKWLGSGIYRCGRCSDGTTLVVCGSDTGARRYSRYTCRTWHLARAARPVDELVTEVMIARLARPDAAELIPASPDVDVAGLRRDAAALRELLDEQARMHARGIIDGRQLAAGSADLRSRLDDVEAVLTAAVASSPLAGIAGEPAAEQRWLQMDLGKRRAILRVLADVTLLPGRPGPGFDRSTVRFDWRA